MPSNYPIYYVTCNDISRRFIIITGNRHFTDLSCLLLHPIRNFVVCTSFLEAARHSGSITLSCLNCTGQFAGTTNHMIFNNWRYLITIFGVHGIDAISERNLHVISFKSLSLSLIYSCIRCSFISFTRPFRSDAIARGKHISLFNRALLQRNATAIVDKSTFLSS